MGDEGRLRQPGEYAQQQWNDRFVYPFFYSMGIVVALLAMVATAWIFQLVHGDVHLWAFTCVGVSLAAFASWDAYRGHKSGRTWLQGAKGEMTVADALSVLAHGRYRVYHDLQFRRGSAQWNVDHVVVGPSGVYAIETKNRTKPNGRRAEVRFDGDSVRLDAGPPDAQPIHQARSNAECVRKLIENGTGIPVPVRPVVLFPGWWVESRSGCDVWVLNPGMMKGWIQTEEQRGGVMDADLVRRIDEALDQAARGVIEC